LLPLSDFATGVIDDAVVVDEKDIDVGVNDDDEDDIEHSSLPLPISKHSLQKTNPQNRQ